ncbi:MAG: flagellar hook-length control protein FliK, partial [Candidatus Dactylopiibacterium sp.]|nr:flagellar hook-length control protein FliK [Candidatus Dactylopiibacterium sp.]
MIPVDLASRLRLLLEATVPAVGAPREIGTELPRLVPGERFSAQILNALSDGSFRALVGGKPITLVLPGTATSGDVLDLVVTQRQGATLQARLATTPATDITQTPQQAATDAAARSESRPTLSPTGQFISQLLTGRFGEARPLPLSPSGRALLNNPLNTTDIADSLKQAISESGVFYESHQRQWLSGERPLQSLLQEPQARVPGQAREQPAPATPGGAPAAGANPA